MKYYLITLLLTILALYVYVKRSYKYATVQDSIDTKLDTKINQTVQADINAPIDYESDKYKEAEAFFRGVGRV